MSSKKNPSGKAKQDTASSKGQHIPPEDTKGITVKKSEDMPEWYTQVCLKAKLADYAPIKGCMVIRPLGFSLWTAIQNKFNEFLAEDGVENAYFPLFIPESFFSREAEHAEGFSPEVAWVENKDDAKERFAIRPTSETIIYDSYGKWIRSLARPPVEDQPVV
jgi:prolyl-tRNA synthetase